MQSSAEIQKPMVSAANSTAVASPNILSAFQTTQLNSSATKQKGEILKKKVNEANQQVQMLKEQIEKLNMELSKKEEVEREATAALKAFKRLNMVADDELTKLVRQKLPNIEKIDCFTFKEMEKPEILIFINRCGTTSFVEDLFYQIFKIMNAEVAVFQGGCEEYAGEKNQTLVRVEIPGSERGKLIQALTSIDSCPLITNHERIKGDSYAIFS